MPRTFHSKTIQALCIAIACTASGCQFRTEPPGDRVYPFEVLAIYPHDTEAFTQGLVYADGFLYEGTGLRGRSSLRKIDLATGSVLQQRDLESSFFGEGVTLFEDTLIQLTLDSHIGFVYDRITFERIDEFQYPTEGWGITHDGQHLIMSDGTSRLHFLDPTDFRETSFLDVADDVGPLPRLNELEYIGGKIFANVWLTDYIAVIDPKTGRAEGRLELDGLRDHLDSEVDIDVLNGIAYDSKENRIFLTGKLWPAVFEIRLGDEPVLTVLP